MRIGHVQIMFVQTFLKAEPRRNGRGSTSKHKRQRQRNMGNKTTRSPPRLPPPKSLNIKTTETFENWLERIRGYPTLQKRMDQWLTTPKNQQRLKRGRYYTRHGQLALVTLLLVAWGVHSAVANDYDDALSEVLREDSIDQTLAMPMLQKAVVHTHPRVQTSSEKRKTKRDWRKKRISDRLVDIYKARKSRMPSAEDGIFNNRDKWLRYLTGSLESDNALLERELEATDKLLVQMYDLVDANHDGASDGMRKRQYMAPILKPVIYDLALHALKADFAFTNATFHKKLHGDIDSRVVQNQRLQKILKQLASKADLSRQDVTQLIRAIQTRIDDNPVLWYDSHEPVLYGKGMVHFLRTTTKDFVRKSIQNIPENSKRSDIEEILHLAAIIDASTSGRKIRSVAQERQSTDEIVGALYSYNPIEKHIVRHYESFLDDQLHKKDSPSENAVNSLIRRLKTNSDIIVKDVRLLWSIYDQESEKTFSVKETRKHQNMARRFLGTILRDLREKDATYRGRDEGRERLIEELEKLEKVAYRWAVTLLATIIGIGVISSKIGCRSCFKCPSCPKSSKKSAKETVRNQTVFRFGSSDKLWIFVEKQNAYRRITKRGHPDFYTLMRTGIMSSDSRKAQNPTDAGRINADSKYIQ